MTRYAAAGVSEPVFVPLASKVHDTCSWSPLVGLDCHEIYIYDHALLYT